MAELLNNYVFLDISENCNLVAKVTDKNKTLAKEYNDDNYEDNDDEIDNEENFEDLQLVLVNNNLQIISDVYSDVYSDGMILNNFYVLDSTIWNKNGKKLASKVYMSDILNNGEIIILKEDNDTRYNYQIWDTNHQIAFCNALDGFILHSDEYIYMHRKDITDVYTQALSQM